MQTVPLMSTKSCHQLANYWGGIDPPIKLLGTCPHAPPEVYAYATKASADTTEKSSTGTQSQQLHLSPVK